MRKGWTYDRDRGVWQHDATDCCVSKHDPIAPVPPPGHCWAAWWTPHSKKPDAYFRTGRDAMQACERAATEGT